MLEYINGDLVDAFKNENIDVLIHGCNCFCTMGAGIALQIKKELPKAFDVDLKTSRGSIKKLGTFSIAKIDRTNKPGYVVNAYTQFHWKYKYNSKILADYNAIRKVFTEMHRLPSYLKIGIPKIGCGLAGGSWDVVSDIITECCDRKIYVYCL